MAGTVELLVVAPPAFAYAAIARSGGPSALLPNQVIYDAERQKIFLYDPNASGTPGSPIPPSPGLSGESHRALSLRERQLGRR